MVDFVTHIRPIFYEIFKILVVINQKICGMWCVELKFGMSDKHHIGTPNIPSFIKGPYNSLVIWHGMTHSSLKD